MQVEEHRTLRLKLEALLRIERERVGSLEQRVEELQRQQQMPEDTLRGVEIAAYGNRNASIDGHSLSTSLQIYIISVLYYILSIYTMIFILYYSYYRIVIL